MRSLLSLERQSARRKRLILERNSWQATYLPNEIFTE